MTAIRDVIVPGSLRKEVTVWERDMVTVRCGRCNSEFDAHADAKTTRCKRCQRVCRLDTAVKAGPNVIPLRRRGAA